MSEFWIVNSQHTKEEFIRFVEETYAQKKYITFYWQIGKQRSPKQNNALHLWLGKIAKRLNDAGLDMRKVLKPEIEIPWTMTAAKEFLWRPVQKAITGKESTKDQETIEYTQIYEVLNRHLSDKFGISEEWPHDRL